MHTFAYSRRPGTVADKAENLVAENIKNVRSKEMIELTSKTQERFMQAQLGRIESVLFEREKNGYYEGHTMNYTQVLVKSDKDISNQILNVKITEADKNRCVGVLA